MQHDQEVARFVDWLPRTLVQAETVFLTAVAQQVAPHRTQFFHN